MRTVSFDIPPQEILTKDSVTIAVDAVVYYKISNANGEFVSWEFFVQDFSNILFNDLTNGGVLFGANWNNRYSNNVINSSLYYKFTPYWLLGVFFFDPKFKN